MYIEGQEVRIKDEVLYVQSIENGTVALEFYYRLNVGLMYISENALAILEDK